MLCNISLVVIFLLIVVIIGLVVFSNYKIDPFTEPFPDPLTEPITTNANPPDPAYNSLSSSRTINDNNNKINRLITQLQNMMPEVKLINYDPNSVYQDVKNSITSNIAILNTEVNELYNTNISSNTEKINKLENTILDLEKVVNNLGLITVSNKKYNTIKSLNNGLELKLVSTPNTYFKDYKTGSNTAGYMVMVNDGCLSVGATDYDIYQCNDKNPKQIFKMEHIMNETAYQNNIDTSLPIDNTDKTNINYPFVMMKSVNNENCLTNNHGNLTVQPCYSFVAQRWFPL